MHFTNEIGYPTRCTVTGTLSIGAGTTPIGLLGILCGSGATAPMCQVWIGQTTGSTTLVGQVTLPLNAFTRIPAICSGGATFNFSSCASPDLTIYWNPIG